MSPERTGVLPAPTARTVRNSAGRCRCRSSPASASAAMNSVGAFSGHLAGVVRCSVPRNTSITSGTSRRRRALPAARAQGIPARTDAAWRSSRRCGAGNRVLGLGDRCASVTLSAKTSQDMTASMAANGSRPACLASISTSASARTATLALIALPDAWNCC